MKCPFCTAELQHGSLAAYETLSEHVCDPNNEDVFLRETFVCKCSTSENCFWNPDGEFYTGNISSGHWKLLHRLKKDTPYGSMWEKINKESGEE